MDPKKHGGRETRPRPPDKEESHRSKKHSKKKEQKSNVTSSDGKNQNYLKNTTRQKKSSSKNQAHSHGTKGKKSKNERSSQMRSSISSGDSPQKNSRPFKKYQKEPKTRRKGCLERFCDWFRKKQPSNSQYEEEQSIQKKPSKNLQKQMSNIDLKGIQIHSPVDKRDWNNSTVKIDVSFQSEEPNFNFLERSKRWDNQNFNNTETELIQKLSPQKRLQEQLRQDSLESPSNQRSRRNSGVASKRHERIGLPYRQQIDKQKVRYFSKNIGDHEDPILQQEVKNQLQNKQKLIFEQSNQRQNNFSRQKQQNHVNAELQKSIQINIKSPKIKPLKTSEEQKEKSIDPNSDKIDDSQISFEILGSVLVSKSLQKLLTNKSIKAQKQGSKQGQKVQKNLKNTLASSFNDQKDKNRTLEKKFTYRPTSSHFLQQEAQEENVFNEQSAKKSQIFGISFVKPKKRNVEFTQAKKIDDDQLFLELNGIPLESRRFSQNDDLQRTKQKIPQVNYAKQPSQNFNHPPLVGGLPKSSQKRQSQDLKKTKGINKDQHQKHQTKQQAQKGCICHHTDCGTLKCHCRLHNRPCTQLCGCIAKNCKNKRRPHNHKEQMIKSIGLEGINQMKQEDPYNEDQPQFHGPQFNFDQQKSQMRQQLVEQGPVQQEQKDSSLKMISSKDVKSYHQSHYKPKSPSDSAYQYMKLLQQDYPNPLNNNKPRSVQRSESKQEQKKHLSSSDKA